MKGKAAQINKGDNQSKTKGFWFGLVWFYGISNILGYLIKNHLYTYILNTYGL